MYRKKYAEKDWIEWTEYTEKKKDILIEVLKQANTEKDRTINQLTSNIVFANKQIINREFVIEQIKELVSNEY